MKKKLTAKVQQLNPTLPQYSSLFAKCVVIEPETHEMMLRKGAVYTIFDIQSEASFDTELVYKVTNDIIHNSYYQSDNISPIQSMEKAVTEARDKIVQLSSDVLRSDHQAIKINFISAVLWGNVMYLVKYGEMGCFVMREGMIKPVNMISEGNFCAFSLVVNNDDVIILCSDAFEKELPPEKLLSSSVSEQNLRPNQACLLLKILVDTSFTEDEVVDFGMEKAISKNKSRAIVEKVTSFFTNLFSGIFKSKVVEKVTNISLPKIVRTPRMRSFKFKLWMLTPLVLILLGTAFFYISKLPKLSPKTVNSTKKVEPPSTPQTTQSIQSTQPQGISLAEQQKNDLTYKVSRTNPQVFYDLKITDTNAEATEITADATQTVATDKISGKIYISDNKTPKFTVQPKTFPGIHSCVNYDGKLSFVDSTDYKLYNIVGSTVSSEQKISADQAFPYSGFTYVISGNTLNKYAAGSTAPTLWEQNDSFKNAKSLAVAYNVYVLTSDNRLLSFSAGKQTDFTVKGLENGLANGIKVVADLDFNYIYVADKGNKSVVVLDDKGNLLKQYKTEKDETWSDLRDIAVSPDEKTLYVLAGSKIFLIDLSK